MSLCHLLRRLSTTTTTRSTIPISFLHQRIHNISISTEHEDPKTNTTDNQNLETNPNRNSIPANDPPQFQIPQNHIPPIPYPITPPPIPQRTMNAAAANAVSELNLLFTLSDEILQLLLQNVIPMRHGFRIQPPHSLAKGLTFTTESSH